MPNKNHAAHSEKWSRWAGDGLIDYEEFVTWLITVAYVQKHNIKNDPIMAIASRCGFATDATK